MRHDAEAEIDTRSRMVRSPDECPHRQRLPSSDHIATCDLQNRCLESLVAQWPVQLSRDQCTACCKHDVPKYVNDNPAVASLTYSNLQNKLAGSARQEWVGLQVQEFAMTGLASTNGDVIRQPGCTSAVSVAAPQPNSDKTFRIGLVGRNSIYGLGHVNRDLMNHLAIDRWIAPAQKESEFASSSALVQPHLQCSLSIPAAELGRELRDLDAILFMERPSFRSLPAATKRAEIPLICIPNWEWIRPDLPWVKDVSLMLCPTDYTYKLMLDWKRRFGFQWEVTCVPWPVDASRFQFRRRRHVNEIVSVIGSGGASGTRLHGDRKTVNRKGFDLVVEVARRIPDLRFLVFTSLRLQAVPDNLQVRPLVRSNHELYESGDICFQPSYWEGVGLPLLECQAAGMPLVTLDAPPMNEYRPLRRIQTAGESLFELFDGSVIPVPDVNIDDAVSVFKDLQGKSISAASARARRFVAWRRGWPRASKIMLRAIRKCIGDYGRV